MLKFNYSKTFLFVISFFFIYSCDNIQNGSSTKPRQLKIEHYLDTIQSRYKNYKTNTAVKDELNEFFKEDFKKAIDNGILSDLPFKLEKVEKCGNKYMLTLNHSLVNKYYHEGVLGSLELDLYAKTNEQSAKKLVEGDFYLVNVAFENYINLQNKDEYCAVVLMSPFMGFGYGVADDEIDLGAIGVRINDIKAFKK